MMAKKQIRTTFRVQLQQNVPSFRMLYMKSKTKLRSIDNWTTFLTNLMGSDKSNVSRCATFGEIVLKTDFLENL